MKVKPNVKPVLLSYEENNLEKYKYDFIEKLIAATNTLKDFA